MGTYSFPGYRIFERTLCAVALAASSLEAATFVSEVSGVVEVRRPGRDAWEPVQPPFTLTAGDRVRTGFGAAATILIEGDNKVALGPETSFYLEEASRERSALRIALGRLQAWVRNPMPGGFTVRTPTALAAVRGTVFTVAVDPGGRTTVELLLGLLGVEDLRGGSVLLRRNEKIQVDLRGLDRPRPIPSYQELKRAELRTLARREVGLSLSKEAVQAAAAREIKLAEYQSGKSLVDVHGERVRLESYILRPRPDQFKFVVLNERAQRFDYFYYLGTFNQNLPTDLTPVLRDLRGTLDVPPPTYLVGYETGRSNTVDGMLEKAEGGHPVDVNHNLNAADDVQTFYDSAADRFLDVTGRVFYQTLFDRYGFYINGKLKYGWTGAGACGGMCSYLEKVNATFNDPISGAALGSALPTRSTNSTFPEGDLLHQRIYESYGDGTFINWESYVISDEGKVARTSDFSGITSGVRYKQRLLDFNYEVVITASEFKGRKIDLVLEPKILVDSGLIP